MNDVLPGGAPAPAEPSGAPIEPTIDRAEPLGSQTPVAEKPEAEIEADKADDKADDKPKTAGDAVRRASEKLKAQEAEKEKAAKPEEAPEKVAEREPEPSRGEGGKFAPKEPQETAQEQQEAQRPTPAPDPASPHREPPARFDAAAKAEWEAAPEAVKGAVHRAIRELEDGHQKYKADAESYGEVREFAELAKQSGTDLKSALARYVSIEQALRQNPIGTLEHLVANLGLKTQTGQPATLRDIAAHVLGQKPDQVASQQDRTIAELRQKVSQLEQQTQNVSTSMQQQAKAALSAHIEEFRSKPEHARYDELEADIGKLLHSGMASTLSEAYEMADRLKPAPSAPSPNGAHTAAPSALAQTQAPPAPVNPAGQKSVAGAPSAGIAPSSQQKPAPSIRDALKRAKARTG